MLEEGTSYGVGEWGVECCQESDVASLSGWVTPAPQPRKQVNPPFDVSQFQAPPSSMALKSLGSKPSLGIVTREGILWLLLTACNFISRLLNVEHCSPSIFILSRVS